MEAKELRIGNLVEYQKGIFGGVYSIQSAEPRAFLRFSDKEIITIFDNGLITSTIEDIQPIPLTEEWLIKFGFQKNINSAYLKWWNIGFFTLYHETHSNLFLLSGYPSTVKCSNSIEIKYLHQLQNLYWCLTGEELKLADK